MQELEDALTRMEIELAWLASEIDAELARLGPADPLLRPGDRRRPPRRRYALAARRPASRVSGGRHPIS
jgi:hypothetical protein